MEVIGKATCSDCGAEVESTFEIDPSVLAEPTRSKKKPIGSIEVFKLTSDEIKQFIIQKARKYVPGVNVEVVPRYCEKKRRNKNEPHHSYASLRIAFSNHVIEKSESYGFFDKIGESSANVRIVKDMFSNIIQMYKYDQKQISEWTKDYKTMEYLEDEFGMNESYINDIREFAMPHSIKDKAGNVWVLFSAAAENVIKDMLTNPNTGKVPGRMHIVDVYPISKDIVEFLVYIYPPEMDLRENSNVRKILIGEEKAK